MKKRFPALLLVVLMLCMAVLSSCQKSTQQSISIDENGVATWKAVDGAVSYGYNIVDGDYCSYEEPKYTTECSLQLPEGFSVHMWPVFENGETGYTTTSDYFGEPLTGATINAVAEKPINVTVDENGLVSWEAPECIQSYTVRVEDGNGQILSESYVSETTFQLQEGYCAVVTGQYINGSIGPENRTEFFGQPFMLEENEGTAQAEVTPIPEPPLSVELAMDENGLVSWEALEGVEEDQVNVVDGKGAPLFAGMIKACEVQLVPGCYVEVTPISQGGAGLLVKSECFGEPASVEDIDFSHPLLRMDKNGLVSWKATGDEEAWELHFAKNGIEGQKTVLTQDTSCQLPKHYTVFVTPIYKDGTRGESMRSAIYAGIDQDKPEPLDVSAYQVYDLIPAIDPASFVTAEDGTVTFTATGPDGNPMRFEGKGISLAEDGISFAPGGTFMALDAIGTIVAFNPFISANEDEENFFSFRGGYDLFGATAVESAAQIQPMTGLGQHVEHAGLEPVDVEAYSPNFIGAEASVFNLGNFTLSRLDVYYSTDSYHTSIREIALDPNFYGTYMEGERYNLDKEGLYSIEDKVYTFRLVFVPDSRTAKMTEDLRYCVGDVDKPFFTVGDLKDKNGVVLDKTTATVEEGTTLEVTIGKHTCDVVLPVIPYYRNAETLHDLLPHATLPSEGNVNTLVVPVAWQGETHTWDDESMLTFKKELGRVSDMEGNVTDYSDALMEEKQRFSLSSYFDMASYGKLSVTSYMTQWYPAPHAFADMADRAPDDTFLADVQNWVVETYPDLDWSLFDRDGNGYIDSLMLLNAGDVTGRDYFLPASFAGGVRFMNYYTPEMAGTQYRPTVNDYLVCHSGLFDTNVIIHEFGHSLGLVDYYDVTYSGINAVGTYDMQSSSYGDWNAYSKYAVGWIEPEIVTGLEPGETREYTIGSMSLTGDAIVIPAAEAQQDGTPFNEYILIDLFTAEGLHQYDAPRCELEGAKGVRIYHVNSNMERRELTFDFAGDTVFPIGTIHVANDFKEPDQGQYLIELIQRGGDNTFTDGKNLKKLRTNLQQKDLFTAGDVFTAEKYDEFLYEGKMDDGMAFGYTVKVVSIDTNEAGETTAVISVTRQD